MIRVQYGICVEDWFEEIAKEKERVQTENAIKELSCLAYWNIRNVGIANTISKIQESDDYIYEFIVNDRLRSMIYARRNDSNTVDIITTSL